MHTETPNAETPVRQFSKFPTDTYDVKNKYIFRFRFHDLRATYGMNILEEKIKNVENGNFKLLDVLVLIRERSWSQKAFKPLRDI
ncbi:MAG: hypothetical protein U5L01_00700 [Rheinheimera sp.]|nr:hypothetical protein [Rheinheimera sp.]